MGGVATANAAETTDAPLTDKESLTAIRSGAFTGKTDSLKAIELGKYITDQSADGGKHVNAIGVEPLKRTRRRSLKH